MNASASHAAWRDVKDYFKSLDLWNFFCAVLSGNFRAIMDTTHLLSLSAGSLARKLESLPNTRLVGHMLLSIALSQWHAEFVLDEKTLLPDSMSSVALCDRIVRPAILGGVSQDAKLQYSSVHPFPEMMEHGYGLRFVCIHGGTKNPTCGKPSFSSINTSPPRSR